MLTDTVLTVAGRPKPHGVITQSVRNNNLMEQIETDRMTVPGRP